MIYSTIINNVRITCLLLLTVDPKGFIEVLTDGSG